MQIPYEGTVIRPPSEAESLIFQVTIGCSDNNCNFCPAYKKKRFRVKETETIINELSGAAGRYPDTRKIFLADGDAMVIDQFELVRIMGTAVDLFPRLKKIGVYASAKSLKNKTVNDLKQLKELKIGTVYLGIESGDDKVYELTGKWGSPEDNVRECLKIKEAGIKLNTTIILGLGGGKYSHQHAENTAKVINRIQPDHVAALTLMVVKGTELYADIEQGNFKLIDDMETVQELYEIVHTMDEFKCLFFSNHASNYFPINARFPKDRSSVLNQLRSVLESSDRSELRSEWMRGL